MKTPVSHFLTTISALLTLGIQPAAAQPFEVVGMRALGMGGAFVAVANDSSATWWNPAGLAAGPFVDVAVARAASPGTPCRHRAPGCGRFRSAHHRLE